MVKPSSLPQRMFRALKLDSRLYKEVEHDNKASIQALYVILIVSLCQAIGLGLVSLILKRPFFGFIGSTIFGFISTVIGLSIWSFLVYFIGIKFFGGHATWHETWRCAGFARSPGIFFAIPFIGFFVNIWLIIAQVVAAKEALDIGTGRALAVCIISFIPYILILASLQALLLLLL